MILKKMMGSSTDDAEASVADPGAVDGKINTMRAC